MYWRDTETLHRHALAVTSGNWVAQVNLSSYLVKRGSVGEGLCLYREAAAAYRQAAELYPPFAMARFNLGVLRAQQGYWEDAAADFAAAEEYQPDYTAARYNLQTVLKGLGYGPGSIEDFLRDGLRPKVPRPGSADRQGGAAG